jgi:hypothetical protein
MSYRTRTEIISSILETANGGGTKKDSDDVSGKS